MPNISVQGDDSNFGSAPLNTGLSGNVNAGNTPVATVGSGSTQGDSIYQSNPGRHQDHAPGQQTAVAGSGSVNVNGKPVHRIGDARKIGNTAGPGISSVQVG